MGLQDFHFYHKMKRKAVDKTLEQCFLKELKATYNNSGESELKHKVISKGSLVSYAPSLSYMIMIYLPPPGGILGYKRDGGSDVLFWV